jgi:hypothetical protein
LAILILAGQTQYSPEEMYMHGMVFTQPHFEYFEKEKIILHTRIVVNE